MDAFCPLGINSFLDYHAISDSVARDYHFWAFRAFGISGVCIAIAIMGTFYTIVPALLEHGEVTAVDAAARVPIILMPFIVLGGVFGLIGSLLFAYEIAISKNRIQWKLLWGTIVIVAGFFGVLAYVTFGRKERIVS